MDRRYLKVVGAAAAGGALLAAGACNGDAPAADGEELEVAAPWTGAELENFEQVLALFEEQSGHSVTYEATGDDYGAFLGPRIEGGDPPDVVMLPQPGLIEEFAGQGDLEPLGEAALGELEANFPQYWADLVTYDDETYGVIFKVAHKSLVWYDPGAFDAAGVAPAGDWDGLLDISGTLNEAGISAWAMCGGSGWTLTDWFENAYLSVAGPEAYDQLNDREIPWTDDSVVETLETLAELWGETDLLLGGAEGAAGTEFPACVEDVYGAEDAAMVFEGDFVAATAEEVGREVGTDALAFPFPAMGDEAPVVSAGDFAVPMTDRPETQELVEFLASPEAATEWAGLGGFLSPNLEVPIDAYPDEFTQELGQSIHDAGEDIRFDLSDLQPSAFGGTEGSGMWAILQDFLADPSDAEATAQELEDSAADAHGE